MSLKSGRWRTINKNILTVTNQFRIKAKGQKYMLSAFHDSSSLCFQPGNLVWLGLSNYKWWSVCNVLSLYNHLLITRMMIVIRHSFWVTCWNIQLKTNWQRKALPTEFLFRTAKLNLIKDNTPSISEYKIIIHFLKSTSKNFKF